MAIELVLDLLYTRFFVPVFMIFLVAVVVLDVISPTLILELIFNCTMKIRDAESPKRVDGRSF
jgi:hypothetical protein